MSTYFVGIDISKYKHDCCIINAADQSIVAKFTIQNDKDGFNELLTSLQSLSALEDIRIGLSLQLIMPSTWNSSSRKPTTALWKLIRFSSASTRSLLL